MFLFTDKQMDFKKKKGFTLIELMVVIAVVAILATLAYPSWINSVRKARRADAINSLQDLRINQSQWRANHASYATTLAAVDYAGGASMENHYTIAFVGTPNATTFLATATPGSGQSADSCGTFAINQDGPNHTGTYADARCWNR